MNYLIYTMALLLSVTACNSAKTGKSSENGGNPGGIPETDGSTETSGDSGEYPETALGWELGSGSYGFKEFTFFEALDKIDSCGLKYVEGFPGHTIGGGIDEKLDYRMDAATREKVLAKL